jgi:hypothetical protein
MSKSVDLNNIIGMSLDKAEELLGNLKLPYRVTHIGDSRGSSSSSAMKTMDYVPSRFNLRVAKINGSGGAVNGVDGGVSISNGVSNGLSGLLSRGGGAGAGAIVKITEGMLQEVSMFPERFVIRGYSMG